MIRRRSVPWIHRYARQLLAGIAAIGTLDTLYLTLVELGFFKEAAFCPTSGAINCQAVLSSQYAKVFGIPLSLFGMLAYIAIALFAIAPQFLSSDQNKKLRANLEEWTWLLLFAGATGMLVFSGYLLYLMAFEIKAFCIYCLLSVICSTALFVITILGRTWEDIGQLFFTGILVMMVALIGAVGVHSAASNPGFKQVLNASGKVIIPAPSGAPKEGVGWEIKTTSGESEIALARHLTKVGVKEYVAYWCPHCHEQKELFGKEAYSEIKHIDCAKPGSPNQQTKVCIDAGIKSYPTWEINGKLDPGVKTLDQLADLTGYQGPRNFKYALR